MNITTPASAFVPADLPEPSFADLAHLPGMQPARIRMLRTINFLKDPLGKSQELLDDYGRVFRRQDFGGWGVSLIGPEANELVMFNKDKIFSSALGWNPVLENLFPHGLMLMDFEQHRVHRKTLSVAFKTEPMRHYLGQLKAGIARGIAGWPGAPTFKFYPTIKALTSISRRLPSSACPGDRMPRRSTKPLPTWWRLRWRSCANHCPSPR